MTDPIVEEEIETEAIVKETVETHTKKQKESIFQTIGSTIWLGVEELKSAIGGDSKTSASPTTSSKQITAQQDKKENEIIKKRGIHEE